MRNSERRDRQGIGSGRAAIAKLLLACCLFAFTAAAGADGTPEQNRQALLKAQGLLKQLAQQKAQADAEVARLRGELAGRDQALDQAVAAVDARTLALKQAAQEIGTGERRQAALTSRIERTDKRLIQTQAKLKEVAERYKALRTQLAETNAAREALDADLTATSAELADAKTHNLTLYRLNQELLDNYRQKTAWDALRQREPMTGIAGVALENELQEREDRMEEALLPANVPAIDNQVGETPASDR